MQGANGRQGEGGSVPGGLRLLQGRRQARLIGRNDLSNGRSRTIPGAVIRVPGGRLGATTGAHGPLADLDGDLLPDYLCAVVDTHHDAPVTGLVDGVFDLEPAGEFERGVARVGVVSTDGVPLVLGAMAMLRR